MGHGCSGAYFDNYYDSYDSGDYYFDGNYNATHFYDSYYDEYYAGDYYDAGAYHGDYYDAGAYYAGDYYDAGDGGEFPFVAVKSTQSFIAASHTCTINKVGTDHTGPRNWIKWIKDDLPQSMRDNMPWCIDPGRAETTHSFWNNRW